MKKQLFTAMLFISSSIFGLTKEEKVEIKYKAYELIKEYYRQIGEGNEELIEQDISLEEYVYLEMPEKQGDSYWFVRGYTQSEKWEGRDYITNLLMFGREKKITEFGSQVEKLLELIDSKNYGAFLQELWRNPKFSQKVQPLLIKRGVENEDLKVLRILLEVFRMKSLSNDYLLEVCKKAILNGSEQFAVAAVRLIAHRVMFEELIEYAYNRNKMVIAEELMKFHSYGKSCQGGRSYCLQKAVEEHQLRRIKTLFDSGLEMNEKNLYALVLAIELGHLDVVRLFIENGADVNYVDGYCFSLIETAVKEKKEKIAEYLLSLDLDFTTDRGSNKNVYGTALDLAAKNGMWRIANILHDQGCKYSENTLIYRFLQDDKVEELRELLSTGFDVDVGSSHGKTPLVSACEFGQLEVVKVLVENGADVNHKYDSTPLSKAIEYGSLAIVEYLLQKGANPLQISWLSYRAFIKCCEEGHVVIIKLFVEAGMDVNYTWSGSERPLMVAIKNNQKCVVQYLFENGVIIPSEEKEKYLKQARKYSCESIVQMVCAIAERS